MKAYAQEVKIVFFCRLFKQCPIETTVPRAPKIYAILVVLNPRIMTLFSRRCYHCRFWQETCSTFAAFTNQLILSAIMYVLQQLSAVRSKKSPSDHYLNKVQGYLSKIRFYYVCLIKAVKSSSRKNLAKKRRYLNHTITEPRKKFNNVLIRLNLLYCYYQYNVRRP